MRQAIVLAAGEGRRLLPFTTRCPKPLLPFLNVPQLRHILTALARGGIERVWINAWHRAEQLLAFAATRPVPGLELEVVVEPRLLGTAGGLANLWARMEREPVLVTTADVLADFDLRAFVAHHRASGAEASMALTAQADTATFGAVEVDDQGRLTDIVGRLGRKGRRALVNASVHLFEPSFLDRLARQPSCLIRHGYLPALAAGVSCAGWLHSGAWFETGTPSGWLAAQRAALTGRLPVAAELLAAGGRRAGASLVHPEACLGPDVVLEGGTTVGAGAIVGRAAVLRGCLLLPGARVGPGRRLRGRILAADVEGEAT